MNNKLKNICIFAILSLIFFLFILFRPKNLTLKKLLGNINSYNNENKLVNTGVMIDSDKLYSMNNLINFKIYNGSLNNMTITDVIIKSGYCKVSEEPCTFNVIDIDDINVNSDSNTTYQFNNVNLYNSLLNRVGIRYKFDDNNIYDIYYYVVNEELLSVDNILLNTEKKEELKQVYDNSISKLDVKSTTVNEESYLSYLVTIINAKEILKSTNETYSKLTSFDNEGIETNISDEEIQNIIDELNTKTIITNASANYIEYNNLLNEISSNTIGIYDGEYYNDFINLYNQKENYKNLSNNYQNMIDNYVRKLSTAYEKLLSYMNNEGYNVITNSRNTKNISSEPAEDLSEQVALGYLKTDDYQPFEGALSLEEYKELILALDKQIYTQSSQNKIDDIIDSLTNSESEEYEYIYGFKRDSQEAFDSILLYYHNVLYGNTLKKLPGDYTTLCENYDTALNLDLDLYINTDELQEVIWNINWDLKKDEQDIIDQKAQDIIDAINALEKKPAIYEEFNEIYETLSSLNPNNYVDFTEAQDALNDADAAKNLKIDKQDIVDAATQNMKKAYNNLNLKNADYKEFDEIYETLSSLNQDYYKDFTEAQDALNDADAAKNLKIDKQDIVDVSTQKMKNAYNNLNLKDADYNKLLDVISKLPNDISKYPSDLQTEINNYINEVKTLPHNLTVLDQKKIDDLVSKGNEIILKLPADITNQDANITDKAKDSTKRIVISKVIDNNIITYVKVNGINVDITRYPYEIVVNKNINTAKVEVGLKSKDSSYEIKGGSVLLPGNNTINIYVKTKDGNVKQYILNIIRKESNNYLKSLIVNNKKVKLVKGKYSYNIKINKNITKLNIKYKTMDEDSKVTIYGNKNLKNNCKVIIKVESIDGKVRKYVLNINKRHISIILFILIPLILLVIIILIILDKKKYN